MVLTAQDDCRRWLSQTHRRTKGSSDVAVEIHAAGIQAGLDLHDRLIRERVEDPPQIWSRRTALDTHGNPAVAWTLNLHVIDGPSVVDVAPIESTLRNSHDVLAIVDDFAGFT